MCARRRLRHVARRRLWQRFASALANVVECFGSDALTLALAIGVVFGSGYRSVALAQLRLQAPVMLSEWLLSARSRHWNGQRMTSSENVASLEAKLKSLPEKDKARLPLLLKLLVLEGHDLHEDVVFDLGLLGDPAAIPAIAKIVENPPSYIVEAGEWTCHPFQRKCAYALARIGTLESRQVLEYLAEHPDPALQVYGKEGLGHWPMPWIP